MAILRKLNLYDSAPGTPERALNNAAVAYSQGFRIEYYAQRFITEAYGDSSVEYAFNASVDPMKIMRSKMQVPIGKKRENVELVLAAGKKFRDESLAHIEDLKELLEAQGLEVDSLETSRHMQALLFASTAELTDAQRNKYKLLMDQVTRKHPRQDFSASSEAMVQIALDLPEVASRAMMGILGIEPRDIDELIEYSDTEKGAVDAEKLAARALKLKAEQRDLSILREESEAPMLEWLETHPEIIDTTFRIIDITGESDDQGYVHFGKPGKNKSNTTGLTRSNVSIDPESGGITVLPSKGVLSLSTIKSLLDIGAIEALETNTLVDPERRTQQLPKELWLDYLDIIKNTKEANLYDTTIQITREELVTQLEQRRDFRSRSQ